MILEITLNAPSVAATIHALAQSAYTVEANQIGCANFPPLRESAEQLRASSNRFLVFCETGNILAALSFVCNKDCATITRLFVSPTHFRQGIARALLAELERKVPFAATLLVSTAEANVPAIKLYRNLGYTRLGTSHSSEGIVLAHFRRKPNTAGRAPKN